MATYEYKALTNVYQSNIEEQLNRYAADGWRLVPVQTGISGTMLVMEREVEVSE